MATLEVTPEEEEKLLAYLNRLRGGEAFADFQHVLHEDGTDTILSKDGNLVVRKSSPEDRIKVRARRSLHLDGRPGQRIIFGELNGVRCYFDGSNVLLTTEDVYL